MTIRNPLARLALPACLLAILSWPSTASAVNFTDPTNFFVSPSSASAAALQDIAVGDFNQDGDLDLATVYEDDDKVSILLGSAGGTFTGPTNYFQYAHANPLSIAIGDFNQDGDPDLATANEGSSTDPQAVEGGVSVLLGSTGGTFGSPVNYPTGPVGTGDAIGVRPQAIAVGEFNGDSDPDLAVAALGTSAGDLAVLLGGSGGTFGSLANYAAGVNPRGVGIGDFNGDSDPDIAVANAESSPSSNISVYLGGAGGSFGAATYYAGGVNAHVLEVGDFNGDSDPDLVVANETAAGVSVLVGGSAGTFGSPTSYATQTLPDAIGIGEFTGDNDPDIAVATQGHVFGVDKVTVLVGQAGATFGGRTDFDVGQDPAVGEDPTGVGVGDFNRDSYADLAITTGISSYVSVLLGLRSYERPIGASPVRVPLVPAFQACDSPDSTHGLPLNFPSCEPPNPASSTVQTGAGSIGYAVILVCNVGAAPANCKESAPGFTTGMQPDVRLWGEGRDVQCRMTGTPTGCVAGSDYNPNGAAGPYTTICGNASQCGTGASGKPDPFCAPGAGSSSACLAATDITASAGLGQPGATTVNPSTQCGTNATCLAFASKFVGHGLRVTDTYNCNPSLPGGDPNACPASASTSTREATLVDIQFPVPVDCIADPGGGGAGSNCGVNTTANALVPGVVIAGRNGVVELGEVQMLDSGPDGVRGNSDDQRFATQGIFIP